MTRKKTTYPWLSLQALNTPYLDLYLMHLPVGFTEDTSDFFPHDENCTKCTEIDYLETWAAMEKLVEKGKRKKMGWTEP